MKKAFTLVEVLIATVILVIVIGAVTAVESTNIKIDSSNKYQIQANGVGQEGVATVRSLIDAHTLDDSKPDITSKSGSYYIDSSNQLQKCKSTTTASVNGQTTAICDDQTAKVNGTGFTRTIVIP